MTARGFEVLWVARLNANLLVMSLHYTFLVRYAQCTVMYLLKPDNAVELGLDNKRGIINRPCNNVNSGRTGAIAPQLTKVNCVDHRRALGMYSAQDHPCVVLTSVRASSMDLSTLTCCSLIAEEFTMEIMIVGDSVALGRSSMCGGSWYHTLWNLQSFHVALMSSWRRWATS